MDGPVLTGIKNTNAAIDSVLRVQNEQGPVAAFQMISESVAWTL